MNQNHDKKSTCRRYIIAAIIFLFLIMFAITSILFRQTQKTDPLSEKVIREAAAKILNKDPNDLTDKDFARIKILHFGELQPKTGIFPKSVFMYKELTDITTLEKFTNLQKLSLCNIRIRKNIPKWMKFMAKYGIYDIEDRFLIDLGPLAKLSNLQVLDFNGLPVKSLKPLSKLTNLRMLDISGTTVSDIRPLKNISKLQQVLMVDCKNITNKQVEDLQEALPKLTIEYIQNRPKTGVYVLKSNIDPMWEIDDLLHQLF
ncbi:MAG: hypothetical protein JW787_13915 [Sedimentisphaerales bacterium]|nr:hypothetical protein [Sedimentisphaerales bacterium]